MGFAEEGTFTFACDVGEGGHCSAGQIITFDVDDNITTADEIWREGRQTDVIWVRNKTYDNETARVGDTVTFFWDGVHNLVIHPTGTCDATGGTLLGQSVYAGQYEHTFNED